MSVVPFTGQSFKHRSRDVSSQYTLNMYPEIVEDNEAKSQYILVSTPGTRRLYDVPSNGNARGLYRASNGQVFGCWGSEVYQLTLSGATLISSISLSSGTPISFADDGLSLVVCDGVRVYRYAFNSGPWSSVSLPFASEFISRRVHAFDKRILLSGESTGVNPAVRDVQWYHSDLLDASSWSPLYQYTAEAQLDKISGFATTSQGLLVIGTSSVEMWVPTNLRDNPFQRTGYATDTAGTESPRTIVVADDVVYYVGNAKFGGAGIYAIKSGTHAERISTQAIEHELAQAALRDNVTITDAVGWTYEQEGHRFIVFTFPSADITLVYDASTDLWHHRGSRDPRVDIIRAWSPIYAAQLGDQILTSYSRGPQVLVLDTSIHTEFDHEYQDQRLPVTSMRVSPVYWDDTREVTIKAIRFDIQTGVGTMNDTRGEDPECLVRISKDGYTWSPVQHTLKLGKAGEYAKGVRLGAVAGRSRVFVIEWKCTEPVPVTILGCSIETIKDMRRV